jgi:uncharacterized Zn finger protein (UPF0148 family)
MYRINKDYTSTKLGATLTQKGCHACHAQIFQGEDGECTLVISHHNDGTISVFATPKMG